jgi:hypothetical protein
MFFCVTAAHLNVSVPFLVTEGTPACFLRSYECNVTVKGTAKACIASSTNLCSENYIAFVEYIAV